MSARSLEQERLACSPMGSLEYVVESQHDGRVETWFVLRGATPPPTPSALWHNPYFDLCPS